MKLEHEESRLGEKIKKVQFPFSPLYYIIPDPRSGFTLFIPYTHIVITGNKLITYA